MSQDPLPPKKDVALALLDGPSVYVHLDPRRDGVVVPDWFKKQHQLVLQLGMNLAVAIPDIAVDDEGISCTLSFNRSAFWCCMPWGAIYALVGEDGRGMIWPEDVPSEIAAQTQKPRLQVVGGKKAKRKHEADADSETGAENAAGVDSETGAENAVGVETGAVAEAAAQEDHGAPRVVLAVVAEPESASSPGDGRDDAAEAGASEAVGSDEGKPKGRELPSYLRVVK
jgi:stringent starvation protein B